MLPVSVSLPTLVVVDSVSPLLDRICHHIDTFFIACRQMNTYDREGFGPPCFFPEKELSFSVGRGKMILYKKRR